MACIQNCPVGAIEYGKLTQGKERYCFEKCRYVLSDGKPFPAPGSTYTPLFQKGVVFFHAGKGRDLRGKHGEAAV